MSCAADSFMFDSTLLDASVWNEDQIVTIEAINEFIKQNGAFGVLVLLVLAFCYWGIPYLARRSEKMQENHDKRTDDLISRFDSRLASVVETNERAMAKMADAIDGVATELKSMNVRIDRLEGSIDSKGNK